jgi:hypothetical protein
MICSFDWCFVAIFVLCVLGCFFVLGFLSLWVAIKKD